MQSDVTAASRIQGNPAERDTLDPAKPIARGVAFIVLLMMVVPPSKAFEGHLEWWCRDPKFRDLKSKYNCKGLLRRRIYLGVDEHVPTEEELEIMVADFGKEAPIFNDFVGPRLRLGDFEQPDLDAQGNPVDGSDPEEYRKNEISSTTDYYRLGHTRQTASSSAWKAQTDPGSGKTYYYNSATKATQWECPAELATATATGWKAQTDPGSGKTYYYNSATKATQWECPAELATTSTA